MSDGSPAPPVPPAAPAPSTTAQERRIVLGQIANRLMNKRVLNDGEGLTINEIRFVLDQTLRVLNKKPLATIEIDPPVIVCGDVHDQYEDLIRIMRKAGFPPTKRYLFLGDYVDRGPRSVETVCTLFAMKSSFPNHFFLLRGNHESKEINAIYGFLEECERRLPKEDLWEAFNDVFTWLPLGGIDRRSNLLRSRWHPEQDGEFRRDPRRSTTRRLSRCWYRR